MQNFLMANLQLIKPGSHSQALVSIKFIISTTILPELMEDGRAADIF